MDLEGHCQNSSLLIHSLKWHGFVARRWHELAMSRMARGTERRTGMAMPIRCITTLHENLALSWQRRAQPAWHSAIQMAS
jgi:hypothetical protein